MYQLKELKNYKFWEINKKNILNQCNSSIMVKILSILQKNKKSTICLKKEAFYFKKEVNRLRRQTH
jgi:hypothetical protein